MKTTIEFRDGHIETHIDMIPNFGPEEDEISLMDENCETSEDDIVTMSLVKRVIWDAS